MFAMKTAGNAERKSFVDKKFFLHVKRSSTQRIRKSVEFIKVFGGQIEQFLDNQVSYILTDVPKSEWPPAGRDSLLEAASKYPATKLMSLDDLISWCSKYINSQSSSEGDDEIKANIKELQRPFIKFEDYKYRCAPSVKELSVWPEVNVTTNLPVGRSIFSDHSLLHTPNHSTTNAIHPNNSAQLTQQATNSIRTTTNMNLSTANNQPLGINIQNGMHNKPQVGVANSCNARPNTQPNNQLHINQNNFARGVKRRHSLYCEICNVKVNDNIIDHVKTPAHLENTDKMNWAEVKSVIETLPSLSTLNKHRLTNLPPPNGIEHQEFVCLHKVDSISQLFVKTPDDFKNTRMLGVL